MRLGYSESTGQYFDMDTGKQVNSAAAETSPFMAGAAATGQNYRNIGENLGLVDPADNPQHMKDLRSVHPKATMAGDIVAGLSMPVPGGLAAQMVGGGLMNYLQGDPESSAAVRVGTGVVGAGLGDMATRMVGRLFGRSQPKLIGEKAPAQTAREAGITVSPGEARGSDFLKRVEEGIKTIPGGGAAYGGKARQKAINKQALEVFGLGNKYKSVGDDTVDDMIEQMNKEFTAVEDAIQPFDVDSDLADDIRDYASVTRTYKRSLGKKGASGFDDGEPMTLNGKSAMSLRSRMLKKNSKPNESSLERSETIDALDKLIEDTSPGIGEPWAKARGKYKFYKNLEKSLNDGDVSAAKLANRMTEDRDATGAIGDARSLVKALRSSDFKAPHGTPGTANQLAGIMSVGSLGALPAAGAVAGLLERTLTESGDLPTMLGAAAGRTGLLEYLESREQQ